jgi:hypothetical protein
LYLLVKYSNCFIAIDGLLESSRRYMP